MSRPTRVVHTPEQVPIRLEPAGPGSRFLAFLVDLVLVLLASAFLSLPFAFLGEGLHTAAYLTISFFFTWGYALHFEVRENGRTPGKRMLGLRVVDGRGLPLTLAQSFVRNAVRALDTVPILYGLGGLVTLIDRDRRRLGDIAADTLVVREESQPVPLPGRRAGSGDEATTLGGAAVLRRIRQRLDVEERELLVTLCLRADRLEPRARYDLMEDAADHFRKRLDLTAPHLSGEGLIRELAAVIDRRREEAEAAMPRGLGVGRGRE